MPVFDIPSIPEAARTAEENARIRRMTADWEKLYKPTAEKYAQLEEIEAKKALDREIARAAAMLGYGQYAGGQGTAGAWQANKVALQKAAQEQLGNVAQLNQKILQQLHLEYLNRKDLQEFQREMARLAHQYRMEEMEKQAELNEPSWWQEFGDIVGFALSMWNPFAGMAVGGTINTTNKSNGSNNKGNKNESSKK